MTWMKHAESGGLADLPDLPYWRGAGWAPTDERPAEPDTLSDPPSVADTPAAPELPGLFDVPSEVAAAPAAKKVSRRG